MDARPPVMRSWSPSPRTGPSSTIKTTLSVFSPVTPPKAPNNPLVSVGMFPEAEYPNDAIGSSVGSNGQRPSSSVGAFTAVNEMHRCLGGHVYRG